jgi:CheY-like chemotaxis protein
MGDGRNNVAEDVGQVADDAVLLALRRFSGSIAHDFNNLLTMLIAYPQLIRRDIPAGSQGHELLDIMEKNAELMAGISARLAHFAQPVPLPQQTIDVDSSVRSVLSDFSQDDILSGLELQVDLAADSDVLVSRNTLYRMLRELVVNACYAAKGGGKLLVKSELVAVADPVCFAGDRIPAGQYISISVSDSGGGIEPDELEHVVEPFVTLNKKKKARGAGLGLTIVFSLLHDSRGHLLLENNDAGGLTATILLSPVTDAVAESSQNESVKQVEVDSSADEFRVLVVDDEEDILNLFKLMLGNAIDNTQIDLARNGHEAVENFRANHYDVIVMDLHMPVMDGHEAFLRLTELCGAENRAMPSVVFCTGYVPPDGVRQAVAENDQHSLLHKPVGVDVLISAVKEKLCGG